MSSPATKNLVRLFFFFLKITKKVRYTIKKLRIRTSKSSEAQEWKN